MLWLSLALLLLGSGLLIPDLFRDQVTAARLHYESDTAPPRSSSSASLIDPGPFAEGETDALDTAPPQRLDVRGNEIARPLARYRVDERGSLYEVHSPQTEVPRLKPPLM
jgi:hypothetical protein